MGKIKDGILGGFSGKVGTVVGAKWRGIDTMRAVPEPRTSPPSPKELAQQKKMALVSTFLQPMRELLEIGFRDYTVGKTGSNIAQGLVMKNALGGIYPDLYIACNRVMVCQGYMPNVEEAIAESIVTEQVRFNWADGERFGKADPNDKAILVVTCHSLMHCAYTLTGAPRSAGAGTLHVPGYSGREVQTWLSFMSKDGKDIATSIFTGQFVVA